MDVFMLNWPSLHRQLSSPQLPSKQSLFRKLPSHHRRNITISQLKKFNLSIVIILRHLKMPFKLK